MDGSARLPDAPGTYVLLIPLAAPAVINAGRRLSEVELAAGWYAYVGSAHGPGGLRARVMRHLRAEKKRHWHVDGLTTAAPVAEVWWQASPERLECDWAQQIAALPGIDQPVPGFGASDCGCLTHLFSLPPEMLGEARQALGEPEWFRR